MNVLVGCTRLTRPVNALICGLSVIVAGSLGGRPLDRLGALSGTILTGEFRNLSDWQWRTVLAALSATCILAAGNVFNDVRDMDCDRINAPHRPLPAGQVTVMTAMLLAAVLALAGIGMSLTLGTAAITIACGATMLLAWYDIQLKRVPFAGNLVVALLGGFAFIYGGIAGDALIPSLVPAMFATMLHLGRELVKDGADIEGDSAARIATVATRYGVNMAARIAALVLGLLAIAVVIPYALGWFGMVYLILIAALVLPTLVYCIVRCLGHPSPEVLARLSSLLKVVMPAGLIAVLSGFQWL